VVRSESTAFDDWGRGAGFEVKRLRDQVTVEALGKDKVPIILQHSLAQGLEIIRVMPRHETLEDLFVREAIEPAEAKEPGEAGASAN
jgi:hypothetical protein